MDKPSTKDSTAEQLIHWDIEFVHSEKFSSFLELIPEAVILSDEEGKIVFTNTIAQKLFQYDEQTFRQLVIEDLVPMSIRDTHKGMRAYFFEKPTPRFLESRELDLCARKKDGTEFPMESALFAIYTESGMIAVNLMRDISNQKQAQQSLKEYAYVDSLTGLPNRRYFFSSLRRNLDKCRRHQQDLALLYIDLDHFKPVNDEYGHQAGDAVLGEIAQRFKHQLRTEDFIARIGGDEFVLMLYPVMNIEETCKRVLAFCRQPFKTEFGEFTISASIGVTVSQHGQVDAEELLRHADRAMYEAKRKGGDCFVFYTDEGA